MNLSPRERRHQRTQQAIIDAARQIIREDGVNGLSIRAIAERIDYSPAGLYEYFGSKEEIVTAVCAQGMKRFAQRLKQVDQSLAPEEYLLELGLAYIDFAVRSPDFFLLMFTTVPLINSTNPTLGEDDRLRAELAENDAFAILLRGVQRCIDDGVFHEQPSFGSLEMAYASWTGVHGIAMLRVTGSGYFPFNNTAIDRKVLRANFLGLAAVNQ